jgi:hypothetical protein
MTFGKFGGHVHADVDMAHNIKRHHHQRPLYLVAPSPVMNFYPMILSFLALPLASLPFPRCSPTFRHRLFWRLSIAG